MQRHFSNRGERLAEVTAARTLAGRKSAKPEVMREGRRAPMEEWFSHPAEALSRPKRKPPKSITDDTVLF